jgi:hypothetical protein
MPEPPQFFSQQQQHSRSVATTTKQQQSGNNNVIDAQQQRQAKLPETMPATEEETPFYHDAREGLLISAANKRKKALMHFNFFLSKYCKQIGVSVVGMNAITYQGLPPHQSEEAVFEFWDKLIGAFITYMGTDARAACNPKGARIGQATAEGYCSSVKVYLEDKFRTKPALPVFRDKQWRQLRDKLKTFFPQRDTTQGAVPSTRQDREAIATACVWIGSPEFAEFWHFLNATHHCSGRGTESALVKAEGVKAVDVNEALYSYETLAVDIQRQKKKDTTIQTLPIYPHRNGILEDFYFSLLHHIVINGCQHEYMFPLFSEAALKKTSEVSREYNKSLKQLRTSCETLADEINESLTSHSNRKGSTQLMAENPKLGFAGIHRTGFSSVSIHTVVSLSLLLSLLSLPVVS